MKKIDYKERLKGIENAITALRSKMTNAITDDARAEIEGHITELEQTAEALRALEAAAAEGDTDNSEQMRAQMRELLARLDRVEDSLKNSKASVGTAKKIVNSREFAQAFVECVQNSAKADEFRANWTKKAKEMLKNGISDDNIPDFLPAAVVNEIRDQFVGKRHRILELVDWTGLPVFKMLWETGNELAHVHERGTQKTEQSLEFTPIEIRPDYIYKYLRVDKAMERESRDSGDKLIRYITRELLDRVLTFVENCILLGTSGTPFIAPTEVALTLDSNNNPIFDCLAYMEDTEGAIAIMSPTKYLELKTYATAMNNRLATHDDVLALLGVEEIVFNKSTFTPSTGTWSGIWFMKPDDYKLVGDRRPDEYTDFNLEYNKLEYLTEIWIGGGCVVPNNFITLYSE